MSGAAPKEVGVLRPDGEVPGVFKGARHPCRSVLLWESPGLVLDLSEGESEHALSDLWFLLQGEKQDPRR